MIQLELDHIFVCTTDPAAAERALSDCGLQFSRHGIHAGQGTANACASFDNAYLELLFAHDDRELHSSLVQPLGLAERIQWQTTAACPFGVSFHPTVASATDPGISIWMYRPLFLPPGAGIPIVTPPHWLQEPLLFLSMHPRPATTVAAADRPETLHRGSHHRITGIDIQLPEGPPLSAGLQSFCNQNLLRVNRGNEYHMAITFDEARQNRIDTLQPTLPLTIHW